MCVAVTLCDVFVFERCMLYAGGLRLILAQQYRVRERPLQLEFPSERF